MQQTWTRDQQKLGVLKISIARENSKTLMWFEKVLLPSQNPSTFSRWPQPRHRDDHALALHAATSSLELPDIIH